MPRSLLPAQRRSRLAVLATAAFVTAGGAALGMPSRTAFEGGDAKVVAASAGTARRVSAPAAGSSAIAVTGSGGDAGSTAADARSATDATSSSDAAGTGAPGGQPSRPVVGEVAGVAVHSVSEEALAVGFHEASGNALVIEPVAAVESATAATSEAAAAVVMPSRGRGGAPTSALDIAVPEDTTIHAPVSGTVVEVADYSLYGRIPDVLLLIQPDGQPDVRVKVLHVESPLVEAGDRVDGGVTPIAERGRLLPFPSQVDRLSGAATPHVHLHVQPV